MAEYVRTGWKRARTEKRGSQEERKRKRKTGRQSGLRVAGALETRLANGFGSKGSFGLVADGGDGGDGGGHGADGFLGASEGLMMMRTAFDG
jgi:hypothetical protein